MVRMTEADVAAREKRLGQRSSTPTAGTSAPSPKDRMYALGRLPKGTMNKTEREYEETYLKPALMRGEIVWYEFESMKLRLADNTFYTPDFSVMRNTGLIEQHEVKGYWTDDARVKIKVAASKFPFAFIAIKKVAMKAGGGWDREDF
jgi:hypothetical protein